MPWCDQQFQNASTQLSKLSAHLPLRTARATELHRALFETLPGFVWGSAVSIFLGAVYVFVFAWIFAGYYVWMHNTSLIAPEKTGKADVDRKDPHESSLMTTALVHQLEIAEGGANVGGSRLCGNSDWLR